ncbi:MAG: Mannosyltransferase [Parcubacteria group bacterium GW2011_GWA2_47_8]|nr:MAG: Mannosyltransferase [Parcubacteria group bacterium GW2011_GWA2_47_8]OHB21207.1 MAG: hypothetical protein A2666_00925 [Parcubacteria group bacterium RIFCSPHIGHO2_01_FULL_47_10b]
MKIGIDAHNLEHPGKTGPGVARYLEGLLSQWAGDIGKQHEFLLYFKDEIPKDLPKASQFKPLIVDRKGPRSTALYYNVWLPSRAYRDKLDLLFLPLYMQPISYLGKTAVTIHDISYRVHPEWFPMLRYQVPLRALTYWAITRADVLLTVSEYSKSEIVSYYGVDQKKIHAIHLGVDQKFKQLPTARALIAKKYGINKHFLFYIGTIFNRRHVFETIKAFPRIADDLPQYQLLISGRDHTNPAQHIDELIRTVNDISGRELVLRRDFIPEEDLVPLFNEASLYVWPSTYEGFGLSPVEAMACGCPVLSTNHTALKETVGDCGFLVKQPDDVAELANVLRTALIDERKRTTLIKKGLQQASTFSWERTAHETLQVFESIH